jgi:hypothetical protein
MVAKCAASTFSSGGGLGKSLLGGLCVILIVTGALAGT